MTLLIPSIIGQTGTITLASLRSPGFLPASVSSFLFDSQWMYWIPLLLLGAVLVYLGPTRSKMMTRAGQGILGLLAVWIIAASLVVSPAERLHQAHRTILEAAQANDPGPIVGLLTPDFHFGPNDHAMMSTLVEFAVKNLRIKNNIIRLYEPTISGTTATTRIHIITQLEGGRTTVENMIPSGNYLTKWTLEWNDVAGADWKLAAIRSVKLSDGTNDTELPPDLGMR